VIVEKVSKRSFIAVVVALAAVLALLGGASAQRPGPDSKALGETKWPALDKVDALKASLEKAGFSLTPGEFVAHDLVHEACTGKIPQAGTNPWPSVTFFLQLPPHPGVTPMPVPGYWQLAEDEAIVLVGQTPPPALFYSYEVFAISVPGIKNSRGLAVGNSINIKTINTIGSDKYNRPVVIIVTGHRETERRVRAAVLKAGYPAAIINVAPISPIIAPLGVDNPATKAVEGSWFALPHRIAASLDQGGLEAYAKNSPYVAYRVKPNEALAPDPEPVPVLLVRGTGHTEMPLYPSLKKLREAILARYAGMTAEELDTRITQSYQPPDGHEAIAEKPYVALQRGKDAWGASRDNASLTSYPNFKLHAGVDDFAIVYGANHQTTGKATYTSFTPYVDKDRWFGLTDGTATSNNYDADGEPGDSARRFLCPDDSGNCPDDVQYLYAWKVARDCKGEEFCLELKTEFYDLNGAPYTCYLYNWWVDREKPIGVLDLDKADINITWRVYVEPATNVGPDDNELLYDRVIYFGPNLPE
jgi:hypothetical protein